MLFTVVTLALAVAVTAQQPAAPAHPPAGQPGGTPSSRSAPAGQPEASGPTGFSASPTLKFRAEEIVSKFGVGYAVT
ncbi:MAG TPA: hypothetical protein VL371_16040, partial [Gemmataceae bacterium]|nr:hypothetical protein [Gemmataceae bacterium]